MLIPLEGLLSAPPKPVRLLRDHLYIEPISSCNLKCKMCYANIINGPDRRTLDLETVVGFVRRYMALTPEKAWILWCGTGEVFLHRDFPAMINQLHAQPAALFDRSWNLVAWNPLWGGIHGDLDTRIGPERNMVWRFFAGSPTTPSRPRGQICPER